MSIVEFDGPPSWFLDGSETGESSKYPWVGVVKGKVDEKCGETVTASLCLVFKRHGQILAPPLIKTISSIVPWRKKKKCQIWEI